MNKTKLYLNNKLESVYYHSLPKNLQFLVFLHCGFFSGVPTPRLSRILCWFNIHKVEVYPTFNYNKENNTFYETTWSKCVRCGIQ